MCMGGLNHFSWSEHLAGHTLALAEQTPNKYPAQPEAVNFQGEGFCSQQGPTDSQHLVQFWGEWCKRGL